MFGVMKIGSSRMAGIVKDRTEEALAGAITAAVDGKIVHYLRTMIIWKTLSNMVYQEILFLIMMDLHLFLSGVFVHR